MKGMTQEEFKGLDGAAKAMFIVFFWIYMMMLTLPMMFVASIGSQFIIDIFRENSNNFSLTSMPANIYTISLAVYDFNNYIDNTIYKPDLYAYIFFQILACYVFFKTALFGWWSAHKRAGFTISKIEMKTHKLKLYGMMTLIMLLMMTIVKSFIYLNPLGIF